MERSKESQLVSERGIVEVDKPTNDIEEEEKEDKGESNSRFTGFRFKRFEEE